MGPIDFKLASGIEVISVDEAVKKIKAKELTAKDVEGMIVLRNIISKFDGHCSVCLRGFKQGTKIKWSKETGALCHPDCETTASYSVSEQNFHGYKRQFDFGIDEENK